jgi:hypothetical protein
VQPILRSIRTPRRVRDHFSVLNYDPSRIPAGVIPDLTVRLRPDGEGTEEEPFAAWTEFSQKAHIYTNHLLQTVRIAGAKDLGVLYRCSRKHTLHPFDQKKLVPYATPETEITMKRLLAKTKQPLWWHVSVLTGTSQKIGSVVRNTLEERLRSSFKEALRRQGWDSHGRRLDGRDRPKHEAIVLHGSLHITGTSKPLLKLGKTEWGEVVDNMKAFVKVLEKELGSINGSPVVRDEARDRWEKLMALRLPYLR